MNARTADQLLSIFQSANIPLTAQFEEQWWMVVPFQAKNGWIVHVYYDGDEFDYVDSITTPDGITLDFWWDIDTGEMLPELTHYDQLRMWTP